MLDIGRILVSLIDLVSMLIVVWCLLSWFPNINWYEQPFRALDQAIKPMVLPFRRLIPPISGLDLSPMVAIFILQIVRHVVAAVVP